MEIIEYILRCHSYKNQKIVTVSSDKVKIRDKDKISTAEDETNSSDSSEHENRRRKRQGSDDGYNSATSSNTPRTKS